MNSRKVLIGCGVALLVGLGLLAVGLVVSTLIPKKGQPLTTGASSMLVNINLPLNGAELPLNERVSVYGEAFSGSTVHDLELWVDGVFSPTKMDSSPVDKSSVSAVWLWTPAQEGVHRLIVRAILPSGEPVNSNVVRVSVRPREQIADLQPATIPSEQLPPLVASDASQGFPAPSGTGVTPGPPPMPPQPPEQPQDPAPGPAGTPSLQGTVSGCDATLLIQDNSEDEHGFYLYRFDPTSTGFARVATLDKHAGTGAFPYLDPSLGLGNHIYYVASFVGAVESSSNLVNLDVTEPQCAAAGPQAFGLQDAVLTTSKAVDKVYCYLSVNQGPWSRVPPGDNEFIYPSAGGFDLGDYLNNLISPPPPGGVTLELECWGWSGGTLVYLGYLKQDVGKGPVQLIGQDFSLIGKGLEIVGPETFPFNLSPHIAPPYNVHFATDADDCIAHTGGVFTEQLAADICNSTKIGFTILTWHWFPGCWLLKLGETCPYTVEDIEGYHIYRQSPGADPVQVTYVVVPKLHVAMIAPSSSGGLLIQPDYFVRAYKGNEESTDSEHVYGTQPKYTVTLTNPHLWITKVGRYKVGGDDATAELSDEVPQDDIEVGYARYTGKDVGSQWYWSWYENAQVTFPWSQINPSVSRAILRWKSKDNYAAGPGVGGLPYGCWISLVDRNGAIIANYPLWGADGYDVTTTVRAWVQGTGLVKTGFVFVSGHTNLEFTDSTDACLDTLGDFELELSSDKP